MTGAAFQKVMLEPGQRLGLLTQGGVMAGSTTSNLTNPVLRGAFVARQLMCRPLALPTDPAVLAKVKPPEPYTGKTAMVSFPRDIARFTMSNGQFYPRKINALMSEANQNPDRYPDGGLPTLTRELGFLLGVPILWTLGIILAVVGAILWIADGAGATWGRRWY